MRYSIAPLRRLRFVLDGTGLEYGTTLWASVTDDSGWRHSKACATWAEACAFLRLWGLQ